MLMQNFLECPVFQGIGAVVAKRECQPQSEDGQLDIDGRGVGDHPTVDINLIGAVRAA